MIHRSGLAAAGLLLARRPAAALDLLRDGRLAAAPVIGVVTHLLDEASFRALREIGATHIRFPLYWHLWETTETYKISWAEQVRRARDEGMRVLAVVHSDAQHPTRGWGGWNRRDQVLSRFNRFMVARVRQFPGMEWQLWNEAEVEFTDLFGALGGHGSIRQRGRWYGEWIRHAYPRIKSADPGCTIVASGTANHPGHEAFIRGYMEVAPDSIDVVAAHAYWPDLEERISAVRRVAGNKPLWITEFGAADPDDASQRRKWRAMIDAAESLGVARMYGYALWAEERGMGLYRPDWSPRPAAELLRLRLQR